MKLKNNPIKIDAKTILKKFKIKLFLKLNKFLFFKYIKSTIVLNHDETEVAIGTIINPTLLKK